ncbi:hypothetical protein AMECASPLE_030948 [Ameca splendens]|uniref:Secreted protein n=1 Tax=Ameca splendens TaxID=208324 RepID=A0ABV0ZGT2_9TELE
MWCVFVGAVVGDAGPGCLPLAVDLLPSEFVSSSCGVRGSIVGEVLGGVCPVVPVGGGWVGIARGPCLAVTGLMGLRSEFIGRLGLFHPVAGLVGGLVWTR